MDPYKVLGVPKDATPSQIKTAHRQRSEKYRPENGGDAWIFQQIQDAYAILKTERRKSKSRKSKKTSSQPPEARSSGLRDRSSKSIESQSEDKQISVSKSDVPQAKSDVPQAPLELPQQTEAPTSSFDISDVGENNSGKRKSGKRKSSRRKKSSLKIHLLGAILGAICAVGFAAIVLKFTEQNNSNTNPPNAAQPNNSPDKDSTKGE